MTTTNQSLNALGPAIIGALQAITTTLIEQPTKIKHDEALRQINELKASAHTKKKHHNK